MTKEQIAVICHQANKAYCESLGDNSQKDWNEAPEWSKESSIKAVEFTQANPDAGDSAQHDSWMKERLSTGWVYGEVKDTVKKTHNCLVPFVQLPIEQQKKDRLFVSIVKALS